MHVLSRFAICAAMLAVTAGPPASCHDTAASSRRNLILAQAPQQPAVGPGDVFRDCEDCPELVIVPPGDFVMGSGDTPYEKPEHPISVPHPFAIGRAEVTFAISARTPAPARSDRTITAGGEAASQ